MRVSAIHPLHEFIPMNLPAVPSISGKGYTPVKCKHCGVTALHRVGDTYLTFTGSGGITDAIKMRFCIAATDDRYGVLHAKITDANLVARNNPAFAHLVVGTMHKVVPPPDDETGRARGLWVAGPQGPVKVLEGEFLPVKVRDRSRPQRNIARIMATGT